MSNLNLMVHMCDKSNLRLLVVMQFFFGGGQGMDDIWMKEQLVELVSSRNWKEPS